MAGLRPATKERWGPRLCLRADARPFEWSRRTAGKLAIKGPNCLATRQGIGDRNGADLSVCPSCAQGSSAR